jgi:HK97 family phage prohead protease
MTYQTKAVLYGAQSFDERFRVKAVDDSKGLIQAYASKFGNEDSYRDIVVPGAYKRTLSSQRKSKQPWLYPYLFQHDEKSILGGIQEAQEDDFGLLYEAQCNMETQLGREQYSNAKMGILYQSSIGYDVPKGGAEYKDGIRYLKEIRLWEISLVTFAANPEATVVDVKRQDANPTNKRTFIMPELKKQLKDFNSHYNDSLASDVLEDLWDVYVALGQAFRDAFSIGDTPMDDMRASCTQFTEAMMAMTQRGIDTNLKQYLADSTSGSNYYGLMSADGPEGHKAGGMSQGKKDSIQAHIDSLHDMADQHKTAVNKHVKAIHSAADDLATVLGGSEAAYTTDPGTPEKSSSLKQHLEQKDHSSSVDTDLSAAMAQLATLRQHINK